MKVAACVCVVPASTEPVSEYDPDPSPSFEFATVTVCVPETVVNVPPAVDFSFTVNVYRPAFAALGVSAFA